MRTRRSAVGAGAAFLLAFGLRAGTAVVTESRPVFPPYYYNDARLYDASARMVLAAWDSGGGGEFLSPGTEGYATWVAVLYKTFAPAPLVPKLANAFLGALSALWLGVAAAALFGRRCGLLAALLAAVWPSHVFFTSQNFKEAPTLLLQSAVLASWVLVLTRRSHEGRLMAACAGALAMALSGMLRAHLLPFYLVAAAAGTAALSVREGRAAWRRGALLLAASAGGGLVFWFGSRALATHVTGPKASSSSILRAVESRESPESLLRPDSPRGISEYRRTRLTNSREESKTMFKREIETEFFPDARFETWADVAAFLPRASFYELFMPLPFLYPLAGKTGRALAAAENTAVLLAFLAAVAGFWRARRRPGAWVLATFVVCLTPAAALFEFDLGSASRHRLQPLGAAVPFAALWAAGAARRRRAPTRPAAALGEADPR